MAREQLEEKDADAIDIFPLGEITCVGRFSGLILPAHSDFKVCYLSLRSSGNCLHLPVFPAKIPQSRDIDTNKPDFRGGLLVLTPEFRLAVEQ